MGGRAKKIAWIKDLLAKDKEKTPPQWYVNTEGQTFVVIPGPVEFVMGSPLTLAERRDDEVQHKRRIGRTIALAAAPVTKEQYFRFQPKFAHAEMYRHPEPTCPIGGVSWDEAARYCNWLSKEEGIDEAQWCYEIKDSEIKAKENYLTLNGYRLPSEAEMEYATRAGALTNRYFGETVDLLTKYAWYQKNSQEKTWPVGSLKPNDLGLFDVQGNVYTWCQNRYKPYPPGDDASDDKEEDLVFTRADSRVLRGGSYFNLSVYLRSSARNYGVAGAVSNRGIRPVRTFIP
jgi:formylglycine-generating enzyme required for sulfatase activity